LVIVAPGGGAEGTGIGWLASGLAAFALVALVRLASLTDFAARGTAHRKAVDEHPADVWHRLAADETAFVEQPAVSAVELLVAVVRQDRCLHLVGDAEHEGVASPDRTRRWCDDRVAADGGVELGDLAGIDAVPERGVDDHRDQCLGVLRPDRPPLLR
jgi:hypothetical protein